MDETKPTILVVDDDNSVRKAVTSVLEINGYKVIAAASPAIAIAESVEYPGTIDLVLSDYHMPGMTGVEMTPHLLAVRPNMKVVYLTGEGEIEVAVTGQPYLLKPVLLPDLLRTIDDTLHPKNQQQ